MAMKHEDDLLPLYSKQYQEARLAGDWAAMQQANKAANAYRLARGEDAQDASTDIEMIRRQSEGSGIPAATGKIKTPNYVQTNYTSPYAGAIDKLLSDVMQPEAFHYDQNKDPLYQQYADQYTRRGQQAMEDTLGKVSAKTGGLASSYAGTAAQQANNAFLSELSDRIPELYQLALSSHQNQQAQKRNDLSLLMGLENAGYGRHRDAVGDAKWQQSFDYDKAADERRFAYGVSRDRTSDNQWQQQFAYGAGRDQAADRQYQQSLDDKQRQSELEKAMERWKITGRLDAAGSKLLGIPAGTPTSDYEYQRAKLSLDQTALSYRRR